MSHRSRASVTSQTIVQPLILASSTRSSTSTASSGRNSCSTRSKADSALGGSAHTSRISLDSRTYSDSEAMAPIYRLYPHQASNSRKDLRSMDNGADMQDASASDRRYHHSSVDTAIHISRSASVTPSQEPFGRSIAEDADYQDDRPSLPSVIGSPEPDAEHAPVSPVISEIDDRVPAEMSRRNPHDHIPARSSSKYQPSANLRRPPPPNRNPSRNGGTSNADYSENGSEMVYGAGDRSSGDSDFSQETVGTSLHTLPPLQTKGPDNSDVQQLEPVIEDDPRSWDLIDPYDESGGPTGMYALEKRSEQMFSSDHLRTIFEDPKLLLKFTGYLNTYRPQSIAVLIYYLDALKALRAINYANAIAEALEPIRGHDFTQQVAQPTGNAVLAEKADKAFEVLVRDDLPAFIAHTWIQVVSVSIQKRITGTLAPHLREASEGLAEVFCLTDPSRTDNPIVFASEEFVRTTQYGMSYVIGRNCRFLQGPRTNPNSVRRLREAIAEPREHTEVFVNYRRDGSPFMNLLMIAPLMDSRGNVRYFIGAQVDVSNLVKECSNMDGLMHLVEKEQDPEGAAEEEETNRKDEFQDLTEMFNGAELEAVRKFGGRMHKEYADDTDRASISQGRRRVLLKDSTQEMTEKEAAAAASQSAFNIPATVREKANGRLEGVYQHYLLIRPAPSLRILFTSPSLRVPGILQSPFLNRIGGSSRVRSDLRAALGEGRGVTAKIRWLTRADAYGEGEGRPRWIHCTPLFGHSGTVGVWMIVLVDEEGSLQPTGRRFRNAPPVSNNIGGKEWDGQSVDRRLNNAYDPDAERSRGDSIRNKNIRPGSALSGRSGRKNVASGDVSEFSFQLK